MPGLALGAERAGEAGEAGLRAGSEAAELYLCAGVFEWALEEVAGPLRSRIGARLKAFLCTITGGQLTAEANPQ